MKIMKSKRITHLLPLVFTSILAHSASAADGVTNTSVLNEFTNPLGTTITSDGRVEPSIFMPTEILILLQIAIQA
jgi:hypothetical protein